MEVNPHKISQELLNALFHGQEEINLEYKGDVSWENQAKKLEIAKTIFAMANERNGGVIVIGVNDEGVQSGLSNENYASFSSDHMRRFLDKKTNQVIQYTIEPFDNIEVRDVKGKKFVFIQVSEVREFPCVYVGRNEQKNPSFSESEIGLRHGALYIRNKVEVGNKEVETAEEWQMLIERTYKRYERETIRRNAIIRETNITNPFDEELSI